MPKARSVKEWLAAVRAEPLLIDIIDNLIPNGNEIILIAGRPGSGKTNLALYMALCLATGTPFFGFPTKQVCVTYLGFEGTKTKLANRLEKIMASFPDPEDYFHFELISPTKLNNSFVSYLQDSTVVIIDPLRYIVEGDFCRPQDASSFITKLKNTAVGKDVTFVLCHHIKKPQGYARIEPDDLFQLKGATEYVDAATTVLLLEKTKRKPGPKGKDSVMLEIPKFTLYFAKARDAIKDIPDMQLHFNQDKLLFEKVE